MLAKCKYFQKEKVLQEPSDLYKGIQLPLYMLLFWTATQSGNNIHVCIDIRIYLCIHFFFSRSAVLLVCSVFREASAGHKFRFAVGKLLGPNMEYDH